MYTPNNPIYRHGTPCPFDTNQKLGEKIMEIKCGTDIIEIERIQKAIEHVGEKFLETVFTPNEIEYCEARKAQKYQHYAARFAAKEAVFKALSDKINDICDWKSFEVIKNENGRPSVDIKCDVKGLQSIDISISHCKTYATANVVAIFKQ